MSSYQINQKCFITPLRTDGVVKAVNGDNYTITYFPRNQNKRKTKVFNVSLLSDYRKPIDRIKAHSHSGNKFYYAVQDFHKAFNHPYATKPTVMDADTALKRMSWTLEEVVEFLHASSDSLAQFTKLYDQLVVNGFQSYLKLSTQEFPENKLPHQIDAACDILYFNQGDFNLLGTKPDRIFDEVQKSNMGKLWSDGEARFREGDGKIIKPEGWTDPSEGIKKEIERQLAN
jgi:predicted HAD superfamily Cof-like phosphohydrolase